MATAHCSLDDFAGSNAREVRVSPFSKAFWLKGRRAPLPPGASVDLAGLVGLGLQLETDSVVAGTDISTGLGHARILYPDGKDTGYCIVSHGVREMYRDQWYAWYEIEDNAVSWRRFTPGRMRLAFSLPIPGMHAGVGA